MVKRTPLKRSSTPMKRTALKRGGGKLQSRSPHRKEVDVLRAANQVEAWGPRPWNCTFRDYATGNPEAMASGGNCYGKIDGHEIVARSRDSSDENLTNPDGQTPLCAHHNGWVSQHTNGLAADIGLSRRREVDNEEDED